MNPLRLLASCLVLTLLAACDRGPLSLTAPPTSPTPVPSTPQTPDPVAPAVRPGDTPPTSLLGVTTLDVPVQPTGGWALYRIVLGLAELSGDSGVWVRSIEVQTDLNGTTEADCPWRDFRIAPGATWESWRLSYCVPYSFSRAPASQLTLSITYTDDEGRPGSLERVVDLRR